MIVHLLLLWASWLKVTAGQGSLTSVNAPNYALEILQYQTEQFSTAICLNTRGFKVERIYLKIFDNIAVIYNFNNFFQFLINVRMFLPLIKLA